MAGKMRMMLKGASLADETLLACKPGLVWAGVTPDPKKLERLRSVGISGTELAAVMRANSSVKWGLMGGMTPHEALLDMKTRQVVRLMEPPVEPTVYCPTVPTLAYLMLHSNTTLAMERWSSMDHLDKLYLQGTNLFKLKMQAATELRQRCLSEGVDFNPSMLDTDNVPRRVAQEIADLRESHENRDFQLYELILFTLVHVSGGVGYDAIPEMFLSRGSEQIEAHNLYSHQQRARVLQARLFTEPLSRDGELRAMELLPASLYSTVLNTPCHRQDYLATEVYPFDTLIDMAAYCLSWNKPSLVDAEYTLLSDPEDYQTPAFMKCKSMLLSLGLSKFLAGCTWREVAQFIRARVTETDPLKSFCQFTVFSSTLPDLSPSDVTTLWATMSGSDREEYTRRDTPSNVDWVGSLGRVHNLGLPPRGFLDYIKVSDRSEGIVPLAESWLKMSYAMRRKHCTATGSYRTRIIGAEGEWAKLPLGFLVNPWTDSLCPSDVNKQDFAYMTDGERLQYHLADYKRFTDAFKAQTSAGATQDYLRRYLEMSQKGIYSMRDILKGLPIYEPYIVMASNPCWEVLPQSEEVYGSDVMLDLEEALCIANPPAEYIGYCVANGLDSDVGASVKQFMECMDIVHLDCAVQPGDLLHKIPDSTWYNMTVDKLVWSPEYNCVNQYEAAVMLSEKRHPEDTTAETYQRPNWSPRCVPDVEDVIEAILEDLSTAGITDFFLLAPRGVQAAVLHKLNSDPILESSILSRLVVTPTAFPISAGEEYFTAWLLRGFPKTDTIRYVCRVLWRNSHYLERRQHELSEYFSLRKDVPNLTPELKFWWSARALELDMAVEELSTAPLTGFTHYVLNVLPHGNMLCCSKMHVWQFLNLSIADRSAYEEEARLLNKENTAERVDVAPEDLSPIRHYNGATPWLELSSFARWPYIVMSRNLKNKMTWEQQHESRLQGIHLFLTENLSCSSVDWEDLADHRREHYDCRAAMIMSDDKLTVDMLAAPTTALGVLLGSAEAAYMTYEEVERIYYTKSVTDTGVTVGVEREAARNMKEMAYHANSRGGLPIVDEKVRRMKRSAWAMGGKGAMELGEDDEEAAWEKVPESGKLVYTRKLCDTMDYAEAGILRGDVVGEDFLLLMKDVLGSCPLSPYLRPQSDVFQLLGNDMRIPVHKTHHLLDKVGDGVWTYLNRRLRINNELALRLLGEVPHQDGDEDDYKARIERVLTSSVADETKLRTLLVYLVKFANEGKRRLYNYTVLPAQGLLAEIVALRDLKIFNRTEQTDERSQLEASCITLTTLHGGDVTHPAIREWKPVTSEFHLPVFEHATLPHQHRINAVDIFSAQATAENLQREEVERLWEKTPPSTKAPYLALGVVSRKGFSKFSDMLEAATRDSNQSFIEKLVQRLNKSLTEFNFNRRGIATGTSQYAMRAVPTFQKYQAMKQDIGSLTNTNDVIAKLMELQ